MAQRAVILSLFTLLVCGAFTSPRIVGNGNLATSRKQIKEIKEGILLVRLNSSRNKINAMKSVGMQADAKKVLQKQQAENQSIIAAFNGEFDFCQVYFFIDTNSHEVKANSSIPILKEDGTTQHKIHLDKKFYIAEFSHIEQDTARYFDRTVQERDSTGQLANQAVYHGSTSFGFGALIVKSDKFVQLRKPFPYYARTLESLPLFKRSHREVVQNMNKSLHEFYNKAWK